jgi:hypothetical protein
MRSAIVIACILLGAYAPASAQVRIGINLSLYPELVQVPGYPVYYAPQVDSNYFFYDGLYWVYARDNWYSSSWYDGPWDMAPPELVPLFVLRVPVRYYRQPPPYFRGWGYDAPPRWGEHWGRDWEQRRGGWDRWDRASAPAPAPLPTYQREYRRDRYPRADQQRALRSQNYHYQSREAMVRQQYPQPTAQAGEPARRQPQVERDRRGAPPPDIRRGNGPASEGAVAAGRPESRSPSGGRAADETRQSQGERGASPQLPSPGVVSDRRPEQGSPPHESPRSPERQTGRPPANAAPTREPKKNPEHERDH